MSMSVCLSVCLSIRGHISGITGRIFKLSFSACYPRPWLGPPLAALRVKIELLVKILCIFWFIVSFYIMYASTYG